MTSTSWTSELAGLAPKTIRTRHIRYWLSVLTLALSDSLSFLIIGIFLRHGHSLPALVLFGSDPTRASTPFDVFTLLAAIFVFVRYLSGDYSRRQLFWDGTKATTVAILLTSLPDFAMLLLGNGMYSGFRVVASWVMLLLLVPAMRQGARRIMSHAGIWQIPTVLVGAGQRSQTICRAITSSLALGFDVRWQITENPDQPVSADLAGLKQIHSSDPARIAEIVCQEGCKEAIVTAEEMQSAHFAEVVQRLLEVNVPVAIIPTINRLPLANATTHYLFGSDILMMQVRSNVQRLPSRIIKRLFDILASLFLLIVLSPLFTLIGITIKRSGPGPVTFSQTRIGRYGIPFRCLKFRTMIVDADRHLARWAEENPELYEEFRLTFKLRDDPRITRVGKWLRKTSLDELPQLWNVLRGDMSLVGPRPVVEQELRDYYGPATKLYIRIRPGITGLWQVSGRSDTSYERRVFLDEWYILNWSFWYDIVILIQTAVIVVTGEGAF